MDMQRNFLIITLFFISFMIWQTWEKDKNQISQKETTQTTIISSDNIADQNILDSDKGKRIIVKTDVLELTINTRGGDIEQALLLAYLKKFQSNEPFQLLETTPEFIYQAQSGLTGRDGPDNPENGQRPLYNVDKDIFLLADGQNELIIPMNYRDETGNVFVKTFTLKRGEYVVNIRHNIQNVSLKPLELSVFGQLKQSVNLPSYRDAESGDFTLHAFRGAAYSTPYKKYEKYKFNTIWNNENLNINLKGGWVAMLQQYFATAWIPSNDMINNFYTINLGNGIVAIGYKSQSILIQPGKTGQLQSNLWIGPEIQDKMAATAPNLDLTVDYGWLWFISQPLFKLLKFIYNFVGNWGFSIIIITFIIRGVMYPLTKAQHISMMKMRMLQPKIQLMRDRLKNDKQRISQEIMALYKSEKVNPLGGCFPLLIQMPIFLALYYMLIGSVELRHAPFILWIHDLSAQDPRYILPILMGITMYLIQKLSPTTITDPIQKKVVTFMPILCTVFFLWFPSGLVLYYIVNNLVTIIQQKLISRSLKKHRLYSQ